MTENPNTMEHSQQKQLIKRLKSELGPHKYELYIAAFLSWIQFIMRILSFFIIAKAVDALYQESDISILNLVLSLLFLNLIGYISAWLAKKYQGTASQYPRNRLKQAFFDAFQRHGGEFDDQNFSTADVMTVASQGIVKEQQLCCSFRLFKNYFSIIILICKGDSYE
ncbi:hypothetical protein [Streptococcus sp. UBA4344]|uniref:hypothetical protein n=1 Tax=Streptococcus sp. UBA4344 TaxID=1947564 RepID=UPI00257C970C|nr:hypothetical protein [Streptococcus sp. UBA4344]